MDPIVIPFNNIHRYLNGVNCLKMTDAHSFEKILVPVNESILFVYFVQFDLVNTVKQMEVTDTVYCTFE